VENGQLSGAAEDLQGRFNLNGLLRGGQIDSAQLARFRHLLAILDLPPGLAEALADWIDADGEARASGGAEDDFYLSLGAPYLAANRALADTGELALVRGFDAATRERLQPFVTALPVPTAVNVNTAPAEVLATLSEGMRIEDARALVAARNAAPFATPTAFLERLPRGLSVNATDVAVGSDYFLLRVRVVVGDVEARGSALVSREAGRWPIVIWRRAT
jgi:general secretion pathway protein K